VRHLDAGTVLGVNRYDPYGVPSAGNLGRYGYTGQTRIDLTPVSNAAATACELSVCPLPVHWTVPAPPAT
jgi:hypothetical protein